MNEGRGALFYYGVFIAVVFALRCFSQQVTQVMPGPTFTSAHSNISSSK